MDIAFRVFARESAIQPTGAGRPVKPKPPHRFLQAGAALLSALMLVGAREPIPGEIMVQEGISYRMEGKRLQAAGDLRGAVTAYRRAVMVFPEYAEAFNDLGVVLDSMNDLPRAQRAYETALRLKPNLATAHTNLALLHEEAGRIQEASEHWVARIRLGPPEDPWVLRAREKLRKYNLPVPESQEDLVQRRRDEVRMAIEGGKAHMEAGRYDPAVAEFERARALDPGNYQIGRLISSAQSKAKTAEAKRAKGEQAAQARMTKDAEKARKEELARKAEAERKARAMETAAKKTDVQLEVKKPAEAPAPAAGKRPVAAAPTPPADALVVAQEYAKEKARFHRSTVQELYQRGAAAMRDGQYRQAADLYRQILVLKPDERDARLALERAERALAASGREADRF